MALLPNQLEEAASSLWKARMSGGSIAPLTETYADMSLDDSYRISRLNVERRVREGDRILGKKIGLTSQAVQKQLGVNEPDFGYLTGQMAIPDRGVLKPRSLIQGKAEGEVAFVLKKDLVGADLTVESVLAATDYVVVCIEIVDSRVRDWKIKIQDTVADNASSAFLVLGSEKKRLGDVDLRMAGMTLRKNGEIESTGVGAACLDHPVNAVLWLAQKMSLLGDPLKAGDVVLSGAYGPVVPFLPGDECTVEINGLGSVSCHYEK